MSDHSTLTHDEFDELDAILDDLRERHDEAPQWEFCEGFMAALICCRRTLLPSEYFPLLLGDIEIDSHSGDVTASLFRDQAQFDRFMALWTRRWNEVAEQLAAPVESLDDERAYSPEVVDVRGAVAALSDEERAQMGDEPLPSFGQVWALGFMYAVESWPDEWESPRDRDAAKWLDESLEVMVALTEDDNDPPEISMFEENGPPSVSQNRLNLFGEGIWAVYDLHELWASLGPRVETVRKEPAPGRNDLCPCGSGKKYKKCHGAN
jgi:uncharacterized protein